MTNGTQKDSSLTEEEIYQFLFWRFAIAELRDITALRQPAQPLDPSGKE